MKKLLLIGLSFTLLIVGCDDKYAATSHTHEDEADENICLIHRAFITGSPANEYWTLYECYQGVTDNICIALAGELTSSPYLTYHGDAYTCSSICDQINNHSDPSNSGVEFMGNSISQNDECESIY